MAVEHAASHDPGPAEVVETHTALLFFVGDRVYKLKKPVDLGFLNHRTREARLAACRDEVALNRRIAPDVYLGVLDVVGDDGEPCDHLVAMRRMPEDRRLARCIERGDQLDGALRTIAHRITTLHEASQPDPEHDRLGERDAVRARWDDGFDQLRTLSLDRDLVDRLGHMEALATRYLDGREPLFAARIAEGRIRDGHGDLQADDVFVLDDGPRILDCIEFGDEYRWGDVLADVAFLAMDLERLGRPDLAGRFLDLHRELSADRWPATLAHHYVAYRAHVRAKVGILKHHQGVSAGEPIVAVGAAVDRLIDLTNRHLEAAQVRLIVVGGLPGTGKSTLAAGLGDRLGAVVLRTDELRNRIDLSAHPDRYGPAAIGAVYAQLLTEARVLLGRGEHVVLDATWHDRSLRELARAVASDTASVLGEVVCELPADVAAARIEQRRARGDDPSEATTAVAADMVRRFASWPEAVVVSTVGDPAGVVDEAVSALGLPDLLPSEGPADRAFR